MRGAREYERALLSRQNVQIHIKEGPTLSLQRCARQAGCKNLL